MLQLRRKVHSVGDRLARLKPRRFHCYCVGAAKTGTTSISANFAHAYRAEHEPEAQPTNRLVIDYLEQNISIEALQAELIERDRRLHLEMESAHPLGYLSGVLAETFPEALFLITVREPISWLRSRLNYHYKIKATAFAEYRDYFWTQRHEGFTLEELPLQKYKGLCSLEVYLNQYADHYYRVLAEIPEDRRLVVLTSEINSQLPAIAEFLGANPKKLIAAHSRQSPDKIMPLDEIDERYVKARIMHHCGDLISEFFPEKLSSYAS